MIMEGSQTLFCFSKFPRAPERISLQFTDNLGNRPLKGSSCPAPSHAPIRLKVLAAGLYIYIFYRD
jgi:hypothetical protein